MRTLPIFGMVLTAVVAGAQETPHLFSPIGIWRSQDRDIQWVYAPKELGRQQRGGVATILRFSPNHGFTLIYDAIYQENGREQASAGDSWSIFYGSWREDAGHVFVSYKPSYIDIPKVENGKMVCPPPVKDKEIAFRGGKLVFEGRLLMRAPKLEESVNQLFHGPRGNELSCGTYEYGQPVPNSERPIVEPTSATHP